MTTPALNNNLNVDDTGNTFGVLNGRFKVYIDLIFKTSKQQTILCCWLQRYITYDVWYVLLLPYAVQMVRAVESGHSLRKSV